MSTTPHTPSAPETIAPVEGSADDAGMRRTTVSFEVLWSTVDYSAPPWEDPDFLAAQITDGSASGAAISVSTEVVTRSRMATLLTEQGSDGDFLGAACRFPGCDDDPEDGEGWDGWCAHHADVIEGHTAADPQDRHAAGSREQDCAVCADHLSDRDAKGL